MQRPTGAGSRHGEWSRWSEKLGSVSPSPRRVELPPQDEPAHRLSQRLYRTGGSRALSPSSTDGSLCEVRRTNSEDCSRLNKNHQRKNRNPDGDGHGFSIRLALPFLFGLPNLETFAFVLLLIEGAGRLDKPMDGVFFIQSQRTCIGSNKPSGKDLIGQFGKIAFFECLHEIRADPCLRGYFL